MRNNSNICLIVNMQKNAFSPNIYFSNVIVETYSPHTQYNYIKSSIVNFHHSPLDFISPQTFNTQTRVVSLLSANDAQ